MQWNWNKEENLKIDSQQWLQQKLSCQNTVIQPVLVPFLPSKKGFWSSPKTYSLISSSWKLDCFMFKTWEKIAMKWKQIYQYSTKTEQTDKSCHMIKVTWFVFLGCNPQNNPTKYISPTDSNALVKFLRMFSCCYVFLTEIATVSYISNACMCMMLCNFY